MTQTDADSGCGFGETGFILDSFVYLLVCKNMEANPHLLCVLKYNVKLSQVFG